MEKCKKCGGKLKFNPKNQTLMCKECKSEFPIKKIKDFDKHLFDFDQETKENFLQASMLTSCRSCGAKFARETLCISDVCEYCGAHMVVDFTQGVVPDGCIPFSFEKEVAITLFKKKVKKGWFVPNKFKNKLPKNNLSEVYVPAYLCETKSNSSYVGRIYDESKDDKGETHRDYRNISGTIDVSQNNIMVECSSQMTQMNLNKLLPYDILNIVKYNPDFIKGYSVEYYNRNLEQCKKNIKAIADENIRYKILSKYSYDGVSYLNINSKFYDCYYSKILLPTYKMDYVYANKKYTNFVNGQSGKVCGKFPVSKAKIFGFVAGILCGIGLIAFLITRFF